MYFNVSFYAQIPFSDLTTKQLKLKMKNNLSYLLRTYFATGSLSVVAAYFICRSTARTI
jgi:hypothetical protein